MSVLHDEADKPKGEIGQRLDHPAEAISLPDLAARWFSATASFTLPGLAVFMQDAGLLGRIRGAFGERLADSASREALAGAPCPWIPPCAFEVLWRKQGRLGRGYDHASPWVLALDAKGGDLRVHLTLFGFAADFMPAALESLSAALVHDVDWRGKSAYFVPKFEITSRKVSMGQAIAPPPEAARVELALLSPLSLTGADARERPRSLIAGLMRRLDALARWHDCTLDPMPDSAEIAQWLEGVEIIWQDVAEVSWQRGSHRQDRWIAMRGITGTMLLETAEGAPLPAPLLTALALGETCHFGADIAFGCGRYALAW